MSTSIVKARTDEVIAVTRQPIKSIDDLQQAYEALRGKCNLLTPITHPNDILPLHRVSLSVVMINTTVDAKGNGPECYRGFFHKNGEIALGKVGLLKLMQAAGLSIMGHPRKVDDGNDPHYSAYAVRVGGRDLRGIWREFEKEGVCDFRDGSNMMGGWREDQIKSSRAHIDSRAETKALEKSIKAFLAVQEKFKPEEAALPFVVPVLVVDPDPSNPVDRAWLLNHGSSTMRQLYGPSAGDGEEVRTLKDVTPAPALKAAPPTAAAHQATDEGGEDTDGSAEDFEMLETAAPAIIVCLCPCGDQREVNVEAARITTEAVGAVRCRNCFPGKAFDYAAHKDIADLKLPKKPGLTPAAIRDAVAKAQAKK
jgi:hypothetical protein